GMWKCRPDPGAMTEHRVDFFGRKLWFVNGFAANDPESTERIWRMALERHPAVERRIAVFNCRADRPERSIQLARAYAEWPAADALVLIGSGTYLFSRAAIRAGVSPDVFVYADDARVEEIFELIVEAAGRSAMVMGMGNIGGPGFKVARFFRNRESLEVREP
ncbi:MAG: poly-gamma-glutamate synthase PgsB, partial [Polyangia bacterium]|nr:poly-gamma-glutamate synthase PgsB [Polyangia bacterium]